MAVACTKRNKDADDQDLYTTPLVALEKLWDNAPRYLKACHSITDPCFGLGDISKFLKAKGKYVEGIDLNNFGEDFSKNNDFTRYGNFLTMKKEDLNSTDCIVMNPPFTLTMEFVDKSLEHWDNVFMFNRLVTLESLKRAAKFKSKEWPLRKVYIFSGRVSCPKGVTYEPTANAVPYAWFWLDKNYEGEPTITWI